MITVRIVDLLNSVDILRKLAQRDFKAKLAWQIARMLKNAEAEIQSFNDARIGLIQKYGEKNEENELITDEKGNCRISPDKVEAFNNELNELLQAEVEISGNKINIEQLENLDFTPSDITLLEPFIEE